MGDNDMDKVSLTVPKSRHSRYCGCWAIVATVLCIAGWAMADAPPATQPSTQAAATGISIAVVDVDRVAREVGWMSRMESNLVSYQKLLQMDMKKASDDYTKQINGIVQPMRPAGLDPKANFTLTPAEDKEVIPYITAQRQMLQALTQKAEQQFASYRLQWVKEYREALAPVVRTVAQDKKIVIVFQRGENILYVDDRAIDITDAVVAATEADPPLLRQVPREHLAYPPKLEIGATAPTSAPAVAPTQPTQSIPGAQP
jgi:Skp family chaperone for outer membrane proteins